ncbi:transporter [Candidatus Riflebacteria bacterium]
MKPGLFAFILALFLTFPLNATDKFYRTEEQMKNSGFSDTFINRVYQDRRGKDRSIYKQTQDPVSEQASQQKVSSTTFPSLEKMPEGGGSKKAPKGKPKADLFKEEKTSDDYTYPEPPPLYNETSPSRKGEYKFEKQLGVNTDGLTGLSVMRTAEVSPWGTFKVGFHVLWNQLEKVYGSSLGVGESGNFTFYNIFFNYVPMEQLEAVLLLPVTSYSVNSRLFSPLNRRESGMGDVELAFKYQMFDNIEYDLKGAFNLGFKMPTGSVDRQLGTGEADFETSLAFSKKFEKVYGHLNLGYVLTGDPNNTFYPNGLADLLYYNVGIEYPHNENITISAELNGEDWGSNGLKVDMTPSIRYSPTKNFSIDLSIPVSVANEQRNGYNYRVITGLTALF